jgi:hypothetical protein
MPDAVGLFIFGFDRIDLVEDLSASLGMDEVAVMDLPRSTGQAISPGLRTHSPSFGSTPIPIPKHACRHWAFCKKSGCKWHA